MASKRKRAGYYCSPTPTIFIAPQRYDFLLIGKIFKKNLGEDGLKPKIGQTGEGDAEKWVRPPSGRKRDGRFDIPERMLYLCATFVLYELKLSL